jgi:hypothetical protein
MCLVVDVTSFSALDVVEIKDICLVVVVVVGARRSCKKIQMFLFLFVFSLIDICCQRRHPKTGRLPMELADNIRWVPLLMTGVCKSICLLQLRLAPTTTTTTTAPTTTTTTTTILTVARLCKLPLIFASSHSLPFFTGLSASPIVSYFFAFLLFWAPL